MQHSLLIGNTEINFLDGQVEGTQVRIDGETFYKISDYNLMRPFFMSVVSDTNHWMFIGSNGGLTAGRKNSEYALFPYYTDEKILESNHVTGSYTAFRVNVDGKEYLWEPFSDCLGVMYSVTRNLYKNTYGNKIIFEEINHDLNLTFKYSWSSSNLYGFVKHSEIENTGDRQLQINMIDGIRNILPYGVTTDLQNVRSNLVDAYKKNEMLPETGLGIYALSAIIVDKAEPSEALKANVAWSLGLESPRYLCSSLQLPKFRRGVALKTETEVKGEKGAYFLNSEIELTAGSSKDWHIIANVNQGPAAVADLRKALNAPQILLEKLREDVENGTENLIKLVASADGIQQTADSLRSARHFSNVLYNIMRGGLFDHNYDIEKSDFLTYLENASKEVFKTQQLLLTDLPEVFTLQDLREVAEGTDDVSFKRLSIEYLPLKFSRRHGDPSRPWNKFSINTQSEKDGSKILDYEGNWRDIFQNWEALAHSFPEFIDGMIHKFLNASTFDGYNPYRVTKDGFDWEVIEPDDPWSYIGYWGDHQIIYLLKFLEFIEDYFPGRLAAYWAQDLFVYANVPYEIKSYEEIVRNPKDTIDFNQKLDGEIHQRRSIEGADGALLRNRNDQLHQVNLAEKLLATLLAKCSNFIPGAGIWLNTQRPEWNDANNALVGNGVSMVTLFYLLRFFTFFKSFLKTVPEEEVLISVELKSMFDALNNSLKSYESNLQSGISGKLRLELVNALGKAGSTYRETVYKDGFSGNKSALKKEAINIFLEVMTKFAARTIEENKREDHLYHAYNLIEFDQSEIKISYLDEMLEGQVAVLSSGYLTATQSLQLLDALKSSALYRSDQHSYILYPDKNLAEFVTKNLIPASAVKSNELLSQLDSDGNRDIIERDLDGNYHFNGLFNNASALEKALDDISEKYTFTQKEKVEILEVYESVFDHKSFTGRSGTFFGYEGLGSIYWHMVSKLLLAVQETCFRAMKDNADDDVVEGLVNHYHEINDGIGVHKSPEVYGAYPTDPYSHTPAHRGAQQPGMTGQVKEDILCRIGELGIAVQGGRLSFGKGLLKHNEFIEKPEPFKYYDIQGELQQMEIKDNSLCFTYCQVPVIYKVGGEEKLIVFHEDGTEKSFMGSAINLELSSDVFNRNGKVKAILVLRPLDSD